MTCISGLVHKGKVWMGGDSAGVSGYFVHPVKAPKVFRNGPFLIGVCGSFRVLQLLRYAFRPPEIEADLDRYMVTTWVDAVRACFKAGGHEAKYEGTDSHHGPFLVGIRGRIFDVQADFQVTESANPFSVVGCGRDYALGSLHTTEGRNPRDRVLISLQAAERFSGGVIGPFVVESA